ncbi:MAG: Hsp20/alpha crystallin family protein [Spirochaetota bacterium]|nr:Hsp20/alpha crystallin family protein [Spirochaetota bacterium]
MTTEVTKLKKDAYNSEECVIVPPVDIYETEGEYVLKAEMPGVTKDNVEITLNNKVLEINGRVTDGEKRVDNLKYSEYNLYNYHREFTIGNGINKDSLSANLENGLLTLVLPKSEEVKPKRIEVKLEN